MTNNKNKINIYQAIPREQLLNKMQEYDIGISLMPNNPIWQTASPTKLMEYYACSIPCIMTSITECRKLFGSSNAGWFCKFSEMEIHATLSEIIKTPKTDIAEKGRIGREIIFRHRNYMKMSENLYTFLLKIVGGK